MKITPTHKLAIGSLAGVAVGAGLLGFGLMAGSAGLSDVDAAPAPAEAVEVEVEAPIDVDTVAGLSDTGLSDTGLSDTGPVIPASPERPEPRADRRPGRADAPRQRSDHGTTGGEQPGAEADPSPDAGADSGSDHPDVAEPEPEAEVEEPVADREPDVEGPDEPVDEPEEEAAEEVTPEKDEPGDDEEIEADDATETDADDTESDDATETDNDTDSNTGTETDTETDEEGFPGLEDAGWAIDYSMCKNEVGDMLDFIAALKLVPVRTRTMWQNSYNTIVATYEADGDVQAAAGSMCGLRDRIEAQALSNQPQLP